MTTNRLEAFNRIFTQVHRVDGPLLVLNLNLLLWTALIPFPTAAVAEYLQAGGELAQTAVALYGAVFLLVGLSFGGLSAWVTRDDRLLGQLLPREVVRSTRPTLHDRRGRLHTVALALAFVSPPRPGPAWATALHCTFDQATVPMETAPNGQGPAVV